ncbi:MAG: DUF933 domain-containing protein [Candidatus Omnitrophica bacterium]|nr:DUF933 domain-containing protein [Candidatus Omnitrophota bacterium]
MKISELGLGVSEGKLKYKDEKLLKLVEKFDPQKISPFFVEFVGENFADSECIAVLKEKLLDLLIVDMEKIEGRLGRISDEAQKQLLERCLKSLEKEMPLCDVEFNPQELLIVKELALLSFKPTLIVETAFEVNELIEKILKKSATVFFYTAGKKEVKAWPFKKGLDVVSCAGKIHSDLARGFIKAEIVNFEDFKDVHNMQEAKEKGVVKLVDRDYIVQDGDILDIRFNV